MRKSDDFLKSTRGRVRLQGKKVLEIGCGDGFYSGLIASECDTLVGIDPDAEKIRIALSRSIKNATFMVERAETLPFSRESFDLVFFTRSLHHIPVDAMERAVETAVEICKRSGLLVFIEPTLEGDVFHEAEQMFGICKGDTRAARLAAREQIISGHPRLKPRGELRSTTYYRFMSPGDFIASVGGNRNMKELPALLHQYDHCLTAPYIVSLFEPY